MIFVPLAGWLAISYGWRSAHAILGIIALLLIFVMGTLLRTESGRSKQLRHYDIDAALHDVKEDGLKPVTTLFTLGKAASTSQFWMLIIVMVTFGLCRSMMLVHIAAHVTDLGFSLTMGASVLAVMGGIGMASRIGMGRLADLIGYKHSFFIGFVVMTASALWALVAHDIWMLYLLAIVFGIAWGTLAVLRMPVVVEIFGVGSLGVIFGAVEFGSQAGAIVGPVFAGWIFDVKGEYILAFITMAVVSFLSSILLTYLKPIKIGIDNGIAR
jgi:predicted MFS family arabinose efflux permease